MLQNKSPEQPLEATPIPLAVSVISTQTQNDTAASQRNKFGDSRRSVRKKIQTYKNRQRDG